MNDLEFDTITAAAAAAAYWNSEGREDESRIATVNEMSLELDLGTDVAAELMEAAYRHRAGAIEDYLAEAEKILDYVLEN